MTLQYRVVDMLKYDEGFRNHPYLDTKGKWTIGWGRNLTDVGISEDEAVLMLRNDVEKAVFGARTLVANWSELAEARQAVLVDMVFNLGYQGAANFKRMLSAVSAGDYGRAAAEMKLSQWYAQVGDRAVRLVRMMESGTYEPYEAIKS